MAPPITPKKIGVDNESKMTDNRFIGSGNAEQTQKVSMLVNYRELKWLKLKLLL